MSDEIPTISSLDELADLLGSRQDLFIRWSRGPGADLAGRSRDELTGVELPGLSVSALAVEQWWGDRSRRTWVARRLYDYRHIEFRKEGTRPWLLSGRPCGRGPDNEPLVTEVEAVAWISSDVVAEASVLIGGLASSWGPLDRTE